MSSNSSPLRDVFFEACKKLAGRLAGDGFKAVGKGQTLKKLSPDRDGTHEIYFQSSFRNDASDITLLPQLLIRSKAVKKWWAEHHPEAVKSDVVFAVQLGYASRLEAWTSWNVAATNQAACASGTKDDAERFLKLFVAASSYAARIVELYDALPKAAAIDLRYSKFHWADRIKLAYLQGLALGR